jgi:hypothetical protein
MIAIKPKVHSSLFLGVFFFSSFVVISQETTPTKALKLYSNFSFGSSETSLSSSYSYTTKHTDFGHFSPAFSWYSLNGNFHEIELSRMQFNSYKSEEKHIDSNGVTKTLSGGYQGYSSYISIRYEYSWQLFKKRVDTKIQSYIGLSASPYIGLNSMEWKSVTMYPTRNNVVGSTIAIVPRVVFNFTEKLFMDVNTPLNIIDFSREGTKVSNPSIPIEQQKSVKTNFSNGILGVQIRAGIGYRF